MPRESSIKRAIMQYLNGLSGACFRKRGPGSTAGDPDVYGCYRGRHFEFEIKQPRGSITPLQEQRLKDWAKAGAGCAVVRSVEDVRYWIEKGLL